MIKVLSEGIIRTYEKDEIIYYQNSEPYFLFLVLSGDIIFKVFKTDDLLKIVNASTNIIPRKDFLFKRHYSSIKQKIIEVSRKAFENGIIDKNIRDLTTFGAFFNEEKLALDKKYDNCAVANTNCILLVIPNNCFNIYLKNKIRQILLNIYDSFYIRFKLTIDTNHKLFHTIIHTSKKNFPEINEVIIRENDSQIYLNLYFIYEGKVVVNKNNLGDIIYLNKGEIFGAEALIAILNKGDNNIFIPNYKYNIINKSKDTILFIIELSNFDKNEKIIRCLNMNLLSYFIDQQKIIKRFEDKKIIIKKDFKEKYKNLSSSKDNIIDTFYLNNKNKRKALINALLNEKEKLTINNYIKNKENRKSISIYSFNKSMNKFFNNSTRVGKVNRNGKNKSVVYKNKKKFSDVELFITSLSTKNSNNISPSKKSIHSKECFLNYERNATTTSKKKKPRYVISNKNVKLFSIYNNCFEIFKEIKKNNITKFKIDSYFNKSDSKNAISLTNQDVNKFNKKVKKKRLSLNAKNKFCLDINNN